MPVHIFDCDGVITDTNSLKTEAFESIANEFLSKEAKELLLNYHNSNGGKSRWEKFNYVKKYFCNEEVDVNFLCQKYSSFVEHNMYNKNLIPGIKSYIKYITKNTTDYCFVASAGEVSQVQRLLNHHDIGIEKSNIYGSPTLKRNIVKRLKKDYPYQEIILYGDSVHDAECAEIIGAKFVFISGYTNVSFQNICTKFKIYLTSNDFESFEYSELNLF